MKKLKTIYYILTHSYFGVVFFNEIPTEGDTVTIYDMKAVFKKMDGINFKKEWEKEWQKINTQKELNLGDDESGYEKPNFIERA